ncbi:MAG: hypothetical protein HY360_26170 [Verrucomicrobia bacterium]|nr:hypothetical protein [Verrucomicrobiota bacterium]
MIPVLLVLLLTAPLLLGDEIWLKQNFDSLPDSMEGASGSPTDPEGAWGQFRKTETSPKVQSHEFNDQVTKDKQGRAVAITRGDSGDDSSWLIANKAMEMKGRIAQVRFWFLRESKQSGFSMHLSNQSKNFCSTVAVAISEDMGQKIAYQNEEGQWVHSEIIVKPGLWFRVRMAIDLEKKVYSVFTGDEDREVAHNIPWKTSHPFNRIVFAPTAPQSNVSFIDDVEVTLTQ